MGDALGHHTFEDDTEDVTFTELPMPKFCEARMIRHLVLESQPTEPAIGEVEVNLLAKASLGPQPHDIADHQHPDHELRIERGTTGMSVKNADFFVQVTQIQKTVDISKEMVGRNMRLEIELIEQPGLNLLLSKNRKPPNSCGTGESEAFAPFKSGVFQQHQPKSVLAQRMRPKDQHPAARLRKDAVFSMPDKWPSIREV